MSKVKPFNSDLAAWCAEYLRDKVAEYGLNAQVERTRNIAGIIEYYDLHYPVSIWERDMYYIIMHYRPHELIQMYHDETLDMSAHRFAHWVRRKIEDMGNG